MKSQMFILASEGAHYQDDTAQPIGWSNSSAATGQTELPWELPAHPNGWHQQFDELTFIVSVLGTCGTAPSAWSLSARFEYRLPHTIGQEWMFPVWVPFSAVGVQTRVVEGCAPSGPNHPLVIDGGYGLIADQTDGLSTSVTTPIQAPGISPASSRVTVSRTVSHQGAGVRLKFLPAFTGGDSTTRIMGTVVVAGRGRD